MTGETVILVHGLGRTARSMMPLQKILEKSGYGVVNISYPSTTDSIEKMANKYLSNAIRACLGTETETDTDIERKTKKLHFVTHSLGGILVRQYLQNRAIPGLDKIVMLAPPNRGSQVADFLKNLRLFRLALGPAASELGTDGVPVRLKSVPGTIGVIAGRSSMNPLFSSLLPGEDDGKVAVSGTRLAEMADFLVVDSGHTFIMRNKAVLSQTVHFLKHGKFAKGVGQA